MSGVRELYNKSLVAFKNEGLGGFLKKAKNYIVFKIKVGLRKDEMKDILFINGCTLPHPERYRVDHQIEQLESCGYTSDKILYTQVDVEKLKFYRAVVIFRCPITDEVKKLIEKAHFYNKKVFYDIDDLVIDTEYTDKIEYVKKMANEERKVYDDGVKRMGETLEMCDYCITTTPALARELGKFGKEVYINRNVASEKMVKLSIEAMKETVKNPSKVKIGYLSGSITHNPDFEMIKPALIRLMDEFANVELVLMGYLDLPEDLARFGERIKRQPFSDWRSLPKIIAELDINLAPIEESIFNEAKSENKWTEAALCKVPTVASDFGIFHDVIENGKTGLLCKNVDEWYHNLKKMVTNVVLRQKIGERAYDKVLKEYITTYTGIGLANFIETRLARNIGFVLPSTNVSGGVNVVSKHCDILRRNGWDVMIINMDVDDKNVVVDGVEINVVSGVKHKFMAKFDELVATLFTTLEFVKKYPEVKTRAYLVQNFETDFNDFGNPMRKIANATYTCNNGIRYLTISKWCQKWLKKNFNQVSRYAPNGIDAKKLGYRERDFQDKIKILVEGNSDDNYKNVDESFKITNQLDKNKYEIIYLSYQGEPKDWYHVDKFYHKIPHDEIGKIYQECDILLKTSILESFSYPPLEMMTTGGYVVVLPNGGNVEYCEDGKNCLFYKRGDIDDAIEKIMSITKDAKLRTKLKKGARETVKNYEWADIEKEVLALYKD